MDLKNCNLSIYIFTLNDDGPSMLSLEEEEELSAANHWLLPTGELNPLELELYPELSGVWANAWANFLFVFCS